MYECPVPPLTRETIQVTSSPAQGPARPVALFCLWPAGLILLPLLGCELPNYKGPQIQEPPSGFFLNPEAVLDRELFPEKEIVYRDAWVNTEWGEVSTIHITGHPGTTMRSEVQEALDRAREAATEPVAFGGLRVFPVDGRAAWGWDERLETPALGIDWVAFHLVVPYDTITYAVELYSGDPTFKGVPDTLAAIASTFAVGETKWNIPVLVMVGILGTFLISTARKRARDRQLQVQSITFVKVKKKAEEEGRREVTKEEDEKS